MASLGQSILNVYKEMLGKGPQENEPVVIRQLPMFMPEVINGLCNEAISKFTQKPVLVHVESPIVTVGDIHGSFSDLITIFQRNGWPPDVKYIFLGDYVDRGFFSIHVLTVLFSLVCCYPDHVTLLRGNHEFKTVCTNYGFRDEVLSVFPPAVLTHFMTAFSYMPLAAVLDNTTFCVHGGIPSSLRSLKEISDLKRPIETFEDNKLVEQLVWADPSRFGVDSLGQIGRGKGLVFGVQTVDEFYANTKLSGIIRGHECVANGIFVNERMNLMTVYSGGACEKGSMGCSAAVSVSDKHVDVKIYTDVKHLAREDVTLIPTKLILEMKRTTSTPILAGEKKSLQRQKKKIEAKKLHTPPKPMTIMTLGKPKASELKSWRRMSKS